MMMSMRIDPRVPAAVRAQLGSSYDELIRVMLDLDVAPIYLFLDDYERLVEVRDRAVMALAAWTASAPGAAAEHMSLLPANLQGARFAESLLEGAVWDEYFALPASIFSRPSLDTPALRAVPELVGRLDDDGLVDVSGLDARPHGLLVGGHSLHYHQLLRRGFSSNIHYSLIAELLRAQVSFGCRTRVAIDERRLRLASEHAELFEHDYWFGAPLAAESLDDLDAVGEAVHGDPDGGRSVMHPYAALVVRWTADDRLKVVQIEELVSPDADGGGSWVLARYLHAIRDTEARTFVHCDGAVKAYERSTYPRALADFAGRGKGRHYRKVFRLDGSFPVETWSAVAAQWFRGNRLILEYLSPAQS